MVGGVDHDTGVNGISHGNSCTGPYGVGESVTATYPPDCGSDGGLACLRGSGVGLGCGVFGEGGGGEGGLGKGEPPEPILSPL